MNVKRLSEFIDIFHENRQAENLEIAEILIFKGIDEEIAWKIVCFMPIAFVRVMLASEEINFPSTYVVSISKEV